MLDWRKIEASLITAIRDMDVGAILNDKDSGDNIVEIDGDNINIINLTQLAKYLAEELER